MSGRFLIRGIAAPLATIQAAAFDFSRRIARRAHRACCATAPVPGAIELVVTSTIGIIRSTGPNGIEKLENRCLLSSVSIANGVLTVQGNANTANKLSVEWAPAVHQVVAVANEKTQFIPAANVKSTRVIGGALADQVWINPANTFPSTIQTGAGNDKISGGGGADTIDAGPGDDFVHGSVGDDIIKGGDGNDYLFGDTGNDRIDGGVGNDHISGGAGNDTMFGGDGVDQLNGDDGNDSIDAGAGDDYLSGGNGNDNLYGGADNDWLQGDAGADVYDGGTGSNRTSGMDLSIDRLVGSPDGSNTTSNAGIPAISTPPAALSRTVSATQSDSSAPKAVLQVSGVTGVAPGPVQVNALQSLLGRGTPLTAKYELDFGDPTGRYNKLVGWNAAHIYDKPGTYKITLTITNEIGKKSSVSTSVIITADNRRTIYVDAATGSDSNTGLSPQFAVKSFGRASALLSSDTRVLFHRGQKFNVDRYMTITKSNVLVGAYGSGAAPILNRVEGYGNTMIQTFAGANRIVIQDLVFDSKWPTVGTHADKIPAHGIFVAGSNIAIRNNTFLNLTDGINSNGSPDGLLVMDNSAPLATGIRGCFIWAQGKNHTYLGNKAQNSTREHIIRASALDNLLAEFNTFTNMDRSSVDPSDYAKGTIEVQRGSHAYVAYNDLHTGQLRIGPFGGSSEPATSSDEWDVFDGNRLTGIAVRVYPGAHHVVFRNNIVRHDNSMAFSVVPQDKFGRTVSDLSIVNNTGIDMGKNGQFIRVGVGKAYGITLRNNLWLAPNLIGGGGGGNAAVFVEDTNLNDFSSIANNVWAAPRTTYGFAPWGKQYVWPYWSDVRGYYSAERWEAQAVVSNEKYSNVPVDSRTMPLRGSVATTAAQPVAGVFADLYGNARPPTGVTAGAVQTV